MTILSNCPKCGESYTYEDGIMLVCPMCGHEWTVDAVADEAENSVIRDANGNELATGDTVVIVKDLKVKGASTLKQ